jgi:hypothetical protein
MTEGETMSASFTTIQQLAADVAFLAVGALLAGTSSGANTRESGDEVKSVRTEKLATCPARR